MLEIVTTREDSEGVLVHDPLADPRIADQPPPHGHGLEADINEAYGILSDPARRREYDHEDARHAQCMQPVLPKQVPTMRQVSA